MSNKLEEKLVVEWNELTDSEPIRDEWNDTSLTKAIAAIKKARGLSKKTASKVDKRIQKSRPLTSGDEAPIIEDLDSDNDEKNDIKKPLSKVNSVYDPEKITMTDEGQAALKEQADAENKEKPTRINTGIEELTPNRAGRRVDDPDEMVTVRLVDYVPKFFYGSAQRGNGTWYGPYKKGARLRVPNKILFILEKGGKV